MGSPDSDADAQEGERPQHPVRITKPFYLGKYLVTQEQWEAVMDGNPSKFKRSQNPVENVSWEDCQQFLGRLNKRERNQSGKFRLPTEAEWEYACRAGSETKYCFGDSAKQLGEYAWYRDSSGGDKPHPVGQRKPNAWGLYDMHGNVWEWCQDWYGVGYYANSPTNDPIGPTAGTFRCTMAAAGTAARHSAGRRTATTMAPESGSTEALVCECVKMSADRWLNRWSENVTWPHTG